MESEGCHGQYNNEERGAVLLYWVYPVTEAKITIHLPGFDGHCQPSYSGDSIFAFAREVTEYIESSKQILRGDLSPSLLHLKQLRHLDLSCNDFEGIQVPSFIGSLANLNYLNLSNSNFGGIIPHQLGNLSELHVLSLGISFVVPGKIASASMSNMKWLSSLRMLHHLDMSGVDLSKATNWLQNHIPGTFSGSIPATLQVFDLSSNEFRGKLPSLSNSSALNFLDLSNNFFTGSLHHLLCSDSAKRTTALNFGNNSLSGVIPECWDNWQYLIFLNMENNNLSGWIPATLGFSSQLQLLNLHGNMLSGSIPASLMNLTNLVILQLGRNELVGSIPAWFGSYASSLRILNLRSNSFHGNIPRELCYLTYIQILDLADNNLSGNIPGCFNNFSVLSGKELAVSGSFVFFTYNGITTTASDSLVIKGREYTYSTILDQMMVLDLSSNYITGHIPSELMALEELNSLNLSRNQLTGRIPEKIGDMKSIESFDVSLNHLSGELPMSLSRLNFLSSFNVSCNILTGRVPSSTQFQTFHESSFFGNKLCGAPLTDRCAVEVPAVEVPDIEDHKEDNGLQGTDWGLIISILIGFLAGFWIVVAPLIVSRSWKIAYFRFLSELWYMVCDFVHKYC